MTPSERNELVAVLLRRAERSVRVAKDRAGRPDGDAYRAMEALGQALRLEAQAAWESSPSLGSLESRIPPRGESGEDEHKRAWDAGWNDGYAEGKRAGRLEGLLEAKIIAERNVHKHPTAIKQAFACLELRGDIEAAIRRAEEADDNG